MTKKTILLTTTLMIVNLALAQHKDHPEINEKTNANSANEQMHQSSTEDLIKRFESPERDAYQKPEKVLEYLGDLNNKSVIDIGAGSGYFS
ncbi:MAG: hypothetical protein WBN25_15500, partial [Eudoraea sp.]